MDLLFLAPPLSVQLIVNGMMIGALFALAAFGMALVWGVMNVINIAQGEFVVLGGYVAVMMAQSGIHPFFAIFVAPVVLYGVGWAFYQTIIKRVVDKDLFTSLLATFGISILVQQLMNQIFGADIRRAPHGFGTWGFFDNLVTIEQVKLLAALAALALGGVMVLFLKKSRLGQAIRATAQNARAARIMGIDTDKVYAATYGLNAAICGAAGAMVAMIWVVEPYIGLVYTIRAFMIAIIAGLGNLSGVVLAGLGLGVAENFAGFIMGAEYQIAFVFSLLVVILVGRSILLGRKREYLK
ncbi:MAG: branched-chain amino acid ABC transporter permease [Rhodospirillaceae bacterium]|nr:branched-chain amino acid ABC transporter permease [Rhodospirillaceae bacterium]MBT5563709.1 branched-chain amino acid ABC transporter permease [Rhodospirillaceae bacterium]MBT6241539.1 branched-chain amino acid ABC transporter permease [Rhodospirillaceae bacterium]MBT7137045.1 branched-chain amino acid ABC transporter permease [Rhodospirillaceae bacterium]